MFFAATLSRTEYGASFSSIAYARYARDEATPWGLSADLIPAYVSAIEEIWGTGACHGDPGAEHGPNGECATTLGAHRTPYGESGRTGGKHACRDGKRCDLRAVSHTGADTRGSADKEIATSALSTVALLQVASPMPDLVRTCWE